MSRPLLLFNLNLIFLGTANVKKRERSTSPAFLLKLNLGFYLTLSLLSGASSTVVDILNQCQQTFPVYFGALDSHPFLW